MSNKAIFTG